MLVVHLAIFLLSFTAALLNSTQQSQPCGRYYDVNPGFHPDAMFTLLPLNDVMFRQNVLSEVSSRSKVDCGRQCVGAEGCVMFTFQRSQKGASGRCQVYGQVYNATQDHEVSPGARSYQAYKRVHNGYHMQSGRCIQVITENLSYHNATLRCRQLDGGHLLFTKTTQDLTFGLNLTEEYNVTRLWVGADDLEKEGEFKWTDGTPLPNDSYVWYEEEPDNKYGNQHYACFRRDHAQLHDCGPSFPLKRMALTVCQKDL